MNATEEPRPQEVPISSIVIEGRHRVDLGDVCSLAKSIADVGLLQPVVITPDNRLIAGERRIAAFKQLGRESIPVTVVNLEEVVRGEWAENAERKPFTPSEAVAIGAIIEPEVRELAAARMAATQAKPGHRIGEEKLSSPIALGQTRDIVSATLGMSGITYQRARAVVAAAAEDPETFGPIVQEMDDTGKVARAYEKMRRIKGPQTAPYTNPAPKPKGTAAERREHIVRLANERHTVDAIAAKVGVGSTVVAKVLREAGVQSVTDRIGKQHKPRANRTMDGIAANAMPAENAVAFVSAAWSELDRSKFPEWAGELHRAVLAYSRLVRALRREIA